MKKFFKFINSSQQLFCISGDFGRIDGELKALKGGFTAQTKNCSANAEISASAVGVFSRVDSITNNSDKPIHINTAASKFLFDGGEYEIYTQRNLWCNESKGGWQPLVSGITASVSDLRTNKGAAPILALWNKQTERGYVFHLLPRSSWNMTVRKLATCDRCFQVEVSLGIGGGFSIEVNSGETFTLPEVLFYEFKNKTDLDCYKLHEYCMSRFPASEMPVIYNTWLSKFSDITYENVSAQVEKAATIGAEYFVIDAGWYGTHENWSECVGDWEERTIDRLKGRMYDIAELVRKNGMKFGLWMEPERATPHCDMYIKHPEYFIREGNTCFLDFGNKAAVEYIMAVLDRLIKRHGIKFLKFDFNADLTFDTDNLAFTGYYDAYYSFIKALKKRHPDVYLENCASGGQRMNLTNCEDFDGFWITDNQSAYETTRIYKDTLLRMPPYKLEKYATIETREDFPQYPDKIASKIFTIDDAAWGYAKSLTPSFLQAFLTGGIPALSCDLTHINGETLELLTETIDGYKKNRDFWKNATCRILCDTEAMLVLQYTHVTSGEIWLQAIANRTFQKGVTLYPYVDADATYTTTLGETLSGEEISENGIYLEVKGDYTATEIGLKKQ